MPRRRAPVLRNALNKVEKVQVKTMIKRTLAARNELKFHDLFVAPFNVSSIGTLLPLSDIGQGDGESTRDGTEIYAKKLYFRSTIIYSDPSNAMRLIIFKFNATIAPTTPNILSPSGAVAQDYLSPYETRLSQDYHILFDRTYDLDTYNRSKTVKAMIPLNCKIPYLGSGATNRAPKNNIWALWISDSGAASHPTANMCARLSFTDN